MSSFVAPEPMVTILQPYTKKLATAILGIEPLTLTRRLRGIESELKLIDPKYSKNSKEVSREAFYFICGEFHVFTDEVDERLRLYFKMDNPIKKPGS